MNGNRLRLLENMRTVPQEVNFSCSSHKQKLCSNQNGQMNVNSSALAFCLAMPWPLSLPDQNLLNDKKINIKAFHF